MRALISLATVVGLAACAGKPQSDAAPAADTTAKMPPAPSAPATIDSAAKPAADSAKPPAKPAAKPTAAKAETGDYDKFIKPKFKVDEKTGKIDTIRKP